jgi:RNA polymerase sigma-70 factor (ECF subfamily)
MSAQPDDAPGERWRPLMAAAQAGDVIAYRVLLGEVALWLRAFYARCPPPFMTEDAVQHALLAIHEKRHTYDPACPFEPWLAAIARHKRICWLRILEADASAARKKTCTFPPEIGSTLLVVHHAEAED